MKLQHLFFAAAALALTHTTQAQVKVGDNPGVINGGSALEVESTNKGLLMPRIALTTTTTWGLAGTPAAGMSLYNTNAGITSSNTSYPASGIGEYYWDGTGWVSKKNGAASSAVTADNGLTVGYLGAGNVGLGGTLGKNTTVDQGTYNLAFTSSASSGTSHYTIDGSTFNVDAVNNRVGVGIAAPTAFLHVKTSTAGATTNAGVFSIDNCGGACGQGTARNLVLNNTNGTNSSFAYIDFVPSIDPTAVSGASIQGTDRDATNNYAGLSFFTRNVTDYAARMTVKSSGNVGIGTTAPATKLEVNNGTTAGAIKLVDGTQGAGKVLTSDANGLATWQTPVTGSTSTTYTASNGLTMSGTNVKLGGAITELTTLSGVTATNKLSITGTGVDAVNISGTTFSVDATNNRVGVGTNAPAYKLDINGGSAVAMRLQNGGDLQFTGDNDNTKGINMYAGSSGTNSNTILSLVGFGTGASSANINLTAGTISSGSDSRLKENIHNIDKATSRLMKLRPVTYNYKTDKTTVSVGLIAQEVDKIFPEVVIRPKTEKEYYSLYYQYFTPYLIKGFQEQQVQIEALKAENAKLTAQAAELADLKLAVADLRRELVKVAVRKVNVIAKGSKVAKR